MSQRIFGQTGDEETWLQVECSHRDYLFPFATCDNATNHSKCKYPDHTAVYTEAARTGTQCLPPDGFFYLVLISHNEESQHQTPEEFGVFQAGEKRVAQVLEVLELLSLLFDHLVCAERRFFPQRSALSVERCRVLAAELLNARRQRMD